jgi:hypothetical protein
VSKVGLEWCVHPVVAVPLGLPITQSMPIQLAQIWAYCNTGIHTPFRDPVLVYTYVGKVCLCFSKFFSLLGGRVDPSTRTNIYVPTAEHNPPSMLSFRFWFSAVLGSILPSYSKTFVWAQKTPHARLYEYDGITHIARNCPWRAWLRLYASMLAICDWMFGGGPCFSTAATYVFGLCVGSIHGADFAVSEQSFSAEYPEIWQCIRCRSSSRQTAVWGSVQPPSRSRHRVVLLVRSVQSPSFGAGSGFGAVSTVLLVQSTQPSRCSQHSTAGVETGFVLVQTTLGVILGRDLLTCTDWTDSPVTLASSKKKDWGLVTNLLA